MGWGVGERKSGEEGGGKRISEEAMGCACEAACVRETVGMIKGKGKVPTRRGPKRQGPDW